MSHVLPLLVRAFDDNDARIQEEVLKKSIYIAKQLDSQVMAFPFFLSLCESFRTYYSLEFQVVVIFSYELL